MSELQNYVPRYIRLGIPKIETPKYDSVHEYDASLKVVDEKGSVTKKVANRLLVPASEDMAKYKIEDFKLDSLIDAGVSLEVFNIDLSRRSLSEINKIAENLDDLESYAKFVDSQKQELNRFFESPKSVEPSKSVEQ